MDISVTVGDKAFYTVQAPAVVFFIESGLEHNALQVRTGIWFGQVHGHGFTSANARNETTVLVFVTKFVKCFNTVLQRPDVAKTSISSCNDFRTHGIRSDREIQATIATWHGHAVKTGSHHGVEVLFGSGSIVNTSVFTSWTFCIHTFCIRSNDFTSNFTSDFKHLVIRVHCIRIVLRSIVVLVLVSIVALLELADALHHRIVQMIFEFRYIFIVICHCCICFGGYLLFAL